MEIESYFDLLSDSDIRLKGTRIGIETIILDYLELGLSPEQIAVRYPTLSLEQVYATLTYYWRERPEVENYLERISKELARQRAEQEENPSLAILHLRELASEKRIAATQAANVI